jgi:hypothetical protein
MKLKTLAASILAISILIGCSDSNKKSKVVSFEYGKYEDTTCAMLYGQVYQLNASSHSKDSLQPLTNVMIKAQDSVKKNYITAITDSNGRFLISSDEGIFNLTVTKKGYQTIKFTNYIADPGQVSTVKIILEKEHLSF